MEQEFQTNTVIDEFKRLFEQSFPEPCHPRQKADLMSFFLAGYQASCIDMGKASHSLNSADKALVFMDEVKNDNYDRVQYLIRCMRSGDYSHKMFQ